MEKEEKKGALTPIEEEFVNCAHGEDGKDQPSHVFGSTLDQSGRDHPIMTHTM